MLDPLSEQSAIESLASSNYKCLRRWSTPTAPGVLIDKLYNESTMNRWYIKCSHCGFEQVLDYEQNIKLVNKDGIDTISRVVKPGTYQYVCRKCGKPIDADRWYNGHWVEEKPGKGKRVGFSISQMDAVWLTADNLKQKELQAPSKNYFYNYVVGLPYKDDAYSFVATDVTDNMGNFDVAYSHNGYSKVVVGIDWGAKYHSVVVMGITNNDFFRIIRMFTVDKTTGVNDIEGDLQAIIKQIEPYNPDMIFADAGYNGNYNLKLLSYFGSRRVFDVVTRSAKSNGDVNIHVDENNHKVTIDKLSQALLLLSSLRRGDILFYKNSKAYGIDDMEKLFITHASNVVIKQDERNDTRTHSVVNELIYTRRAGDHLFTAMMYALCAMRVLINKGADINISNILVQPEKTNIQEEYHLSSGNSGVVDTIVDM